MKKLTLAVPNGGLFETTINLLKKIGLDIEIKGRSFEGTITEGIFDKIYVMRARQIPIAIRDGMADCGICGWDCVVEAVLEEKLKKVVELNYSKTTKKPTKVVIFGKSTKFIDNENIRVFSEYPNITKKTFKKAEIELSQGSTEVHVLNHLYDYGVCISETGKSLLDNGLKVVKVLLSSPTVLITRKKLIPEIQIFGEMLKGALEAEKYSLIKMRVSAAILEQVIMCLPCLPALKPDVSRLANGDDYTVSAVVRKNKLITTIIQLRKLGLTDILSWNLNNMII